VRNRTDREERAVGDKREVDEERKKLEVGASSRAGARVFVHGGAAIRG